MKFEVKLEGTTFSPAAATLFASSFLAGDQNLTGLEGNDTTMTGPGSFIFSTLAFSISGVFVLSALVLTCYQVS